MSHTHERTRLIAWLMSVFAGCIVSLGCIGDELPKYEVFGEEDQDEYAEAQLGEFGVSIPVPERHSLATPGQTLRLHFELHALCRADDKEDIEALVERRAGQFRDEVIRSCRRASLEQLNDPNLSALRFNLVNVARAYLGGDMVKDIVVTNFQFEPQ